MVSKEKREKKLRELDSRTYDNSTIVLNDLSLNYNKPSLLKLIDIEYGDIFPSGMYYDKMGNWLDEPDFSKTIFDGEGPYETSDVQIHNGDIVIDCGANMGIFSILAVKRGANTVYAFDPQENALNLLNDNICMNNCTGKIIPVPLGLSDKKCTLSFTENDENIDASRISREGDIETTTIECTTLDEWVAENDIPHIDFIKADIEGAERQMMKGSVETLARDAPKISICTYHFKDDAEVLRRIIKGANPVYRISEKWKKMYAKV